MCGANAKQQDDCYIHLLEGTIYSTTCTHLVYNKTFIMALIDPYIFIILQK